MWPRERNSIRPATGREWWPAGKWGGPSTTSSISRGKARDLKYNVEYGIVVTSQDMYCSMLWIGSVVWCSSIRGIHELDTKMPNWTSNS
jgi:hypothetical protein